MNDGFYFIIFKKDFNVKKTFVKIAFPLKTLKSLKKNSMF